MAQKLTSTQVLLNEYIKKEYAENPQYQNEGNFFEFFAAAQVPKERDLSDEEIDAGICGTAHEYWQTEQ
jgi:hypothetical protein